MSFIHTIGQKLLLTFEGTHPSPDILATIRRQHVGGISLFRHLNIVDPAQVRTLTTALQHAARESGQPPLLIAADQEGGQLIAVGGTTPFPGNMALGATWSADLARQAGYALGREVAAMGMNVNYAPVCDVNSNPRNPVIGTRSFGEDPQMVAQLCAAMITGMQAAGIAATAKHFPGHGDTSSDSHHGMPVVPRALDQIQLTELPPFVAAIAAGVRLVMSAHIAMPALSNGQTLPATLSPAILSGLLRKEMGFTGLIVSDALDMAAIGQGQDLVADSVRAIAAGIDLLLLGHASKLCHDVYSGIIQATQRSVLKTSDLLASVERVLSLKRWLLSQEQPDLSVIGSAKHRDLAFEIATRSVTLVRDTSGLVPLSLSSDARLAVIMPQPTDLTPADTSSYVSCGLAAAVRRYHRSTDEFVLAADPSDAEIAALLPTLENYDLVIIGTINATAQPGQATLVNAILARGIPTVAIALRMPYDLAAYPTAPTYLCTYSILPPAMEAVAQALWGDIPFSGRLPVSIPQLYPCGHGLFRSSYGNDYERAVGAEAAIA